MANSVLDAIRQGDWTFEPDDVSEERYKSTAALPGSQSKVATMAERASSGLPLWHSEDRKCYDETGDLSDCVSD